MYLSCLCEMRIHLHRSSETEVESLFQCVRDHPGEPGVVELETQVLPDVVGTAGTTAVQHRRIATAAVGMIDRCVEGDLTALQVVLERDDQLAG